MNRHKPSVDVLFRSAAEYKGARTIAQNEATCIVYGMPMEAVKLDAVDREVPLEQVASEILNFDARG